MFDTNGFPKDFLTAVFLGQIPGYAVGEILARQPATLVADEFHDMWGGGDFTWPTSAETWEAVSDSDEDKPGGAGLSSITTISHTFPNKELQTTVTELNGLTPVTMLNAHYRPRSTGGSANSVGSAKANVGKITIRVTGGGEERNIIPVNFSNSQDGHYTVEAGKTVFGTQIGIVIPKNEDATILSLITRDGSNQPTFIGAEFSVYQQGLIIPLNSPFQLPEKTDIILQSESTGLGMTTLAFIDLLIIDNQYLPTEVSQILRIR